jgi:hypothetical protein
MNLRATLLLSLVCVSALAQAEELPLAFNGTDFTGWVVPEDNEWWAVKDGLLEVRSDPEKKGSNLFTEKEYGNFVMQFEFKMGAGTVDSGIFMRGKHDQIQIGESGSLKRDLTGSPYIPGKGYPVEAEGVAELLKPDDWNSMTIVAMGPTYTVWLNGKLVLNYTSKTSKKRGPIGIQLHPDRDMAIDYRDIRIAELD